MDKTIDIDKLLTEINRQLPLEQQIQKDDPMYVGIILNKIALDSYVHLMRQSLDETLFQLTAASEQQVQNAEAIAKSLISEAGDRIEKQLDVAAHRWEERLQTTAAETETKIRQTAWCTWVNIGLIVMYACLTIGSYLGNVLFTICHRIMPFPF